MPTNDPNAPREPVNPNDPRVEPPVNADPRYTDPAADPRMTNNTVIERGGGGYGGWVVAGIIAVLVVVAAIAFTGPSTDPGTTASIANDDALVQDSDTNAPPANAVEPADQDQNAQAPANATDQQAPAATQDEQAPEPNQ